MGILNCVWAVRFARRCLPEKRRFHMPITELKKLNFLLRFRERDLAVLRRNRNPDADAIALTERAIARLKAEIARLAYPQPMPLREPVRLL
jgi:hypothetical protein